MKKLLLSIAICCASMLGGCAEKGILDSMTDASTIETFTACFTCAEGVQARAAGEAKVKEFADLLKEIKIPEN